MCSFCFCVNRFLFFIKSSTLLSGIKNPFPKILSIPKLPNAESAPVAKCGAPFPTAFVA